MSDKSSVRPEREALVRARSTFQDQLVFVAGIVFVLLVPSAIGILVSNATAAWIALLSGAFVTVISKFDRIAEFSLGPLRARMREVVAEATATIDQLRELATSTTSAFLTNLIANSFMGGMSNERRFRVHDELVEQLRLLRVTEEQLERAEAGWKLGVGVIYHRIIGKRITDKAIEEARNSNTLQNEIQALLDFPNWAVPPPEKFENFAQERNMLTPAVQSWIDDYRHFRRTGEIRRRDEFLKG